MQLTIAGAQLYLTTSQVALAFGVVSWDEYLLRMRFIKDCGEPGTVEVRSASDVLREEEFEGQDEWPSPEPEDRAAAEGPSESQLSVSTHDLSPYPPILELIPAASTGLHDWLFHQADPDYFPSIPHGHWHSDHRRKLHAYRGWVYQEDRQVGREPRRNIVALWNDEKFRTFAAVAIQYYLVTYPKYAWPVRHPLRLPRRR
jgi:hypothetical protein